MQKNESKNKLSSEECKDYIGAHRITKISLFETARALSIRFFGEF
ncbi:hypothetical protein DLNHIDIE_03084 [Acidithiobacillus thiooxidans ATCC 19377]|uniref:Uncharacterized protein n=1 Tax=Acidithiobacillus thiooxidans ATCC 19377 TaxID=637390 RepID=A0A543Q015_ACITH|nr:hypothetical protein DLNHIDIE_03084 [Acidithiobacillus thiooxidans ATCC 19377]